MKSREFFNLVTLGCYIVAESQSVWKLCYGCVYELVWTDRQAGR